MYANDSNTFCSPQTKKCTAAVAVAGGTVASITKSGACPAGTYGDDASTPVTCTAWCALVAWEDTWSAVCCSCTHLHSGLPALALQHDPFAHPSLVQPARQNLRRWRHLWDRLRCRHRQPLPGPVNRLHLLLSRHQPGHQLCGRRLLHHPLLRPELCRRCDGQQCAD